MIKTDNISYLKRGYDKNILRKIVFMDRDGTIHIDKVETHLIDDLEFSLILYHLCKKSHH